MELVEIEQEMTYLNDEIVEDLTILKEQLKKLSEELYDLNNMQELMERFIIIRDLVYKIEYADNVFKEYKELREGKL